MHREYVKDQTASIDDLDLKNLLQSALLRWREFIVCNEQREAGFRFCGNQFAGLTRSNVGIWIRVPSLLPLGTNDLSTGRPCKTGKLFKAINRWPTKIVAAFNSNQKCTLYWWSN
jgi:hypothetical protein